MNPPRRYADLVSCCCGSKHTGLVGGTELSEVRIVFRGYGLVKVHKERRGEQPIILGTPLILRLSAPRKELSFTANGVGGVQWLADIGDTETMLG